LENAVSASATSPMAPPRPMISTLALHRHVLPEGDQRVDGLVGQVGDVRFLGVVPVAVLELGVDEPLHSGRERQHGGWPPDTRLANLGQAADRLGARRVPGVVQPHRDEHEQALADVLRRGRTAGPACRA